MSKKTVFIQGASSSEFIGNSIAKHQSKTTIGAHNIFLDYWVQGGVAGFLILILLVCSAIKNFIFYKKYLHLVLLIGILTVMSYNPVSITTLVQFWFLIGNSFQNSQ